MRAWPMDTPFNVADLSMQPPASFPELYQELWWYSGSYASANSAVGAVAGQNFVQKGTGAVATSTTGSATKLYTLNANWNPNLKYAFEATIWANGGTAYAQLWDITAGSAVSGAQISNASLGNQTVIRSGQFTLIPGHVYGVTIWNPSSGWVVNITDASLIVFPPAGSVSPSLSSISLANPSGGSLKEAYIPLWVYSSGSASNTTSTLLLQKGSTACANVPASYASQNVLHTLSSSWSPTQKFAFEVSAWGSSANAMTINLYDLVSKTVLATISPSTSTTTATVFRSGSFTATPGNKLGVQIFTSSGTMYLTKAHLVALGG